MFILLLGPKGSGKSHIGRILEKRLGVFFFHVEPLWMQYYAHCEAEAKSPEITEGIKTVHPQIRDVIHNCKHVCVETTGASAEILNDLLTLAERTQIIIARIRAPLELCLKRIESRNPVHQIPMESEMIRHVYKLSEALEIEPDVELNNSTLSEDEIVSSFGSLLNQRA